MQRGNPEIQRRAQEVIDRCVALGDNNPILSIHDVGAGGLSNAVPEIVHGAERAVRSSCARCPNDDPGMTPMQIWCNEAQERYVLAIAAEGLATFEALCQRERCPYAVIGVATREPELTVTDRQFSSQPVALPMNVLFGKPPKMLRDVAGHSVEAPSPLVGRVEGEGLSLADAVARVLRFPAVADKSFLITIGDRTVTGLVCRDQMVGTLASSGQRCRGHDHQLRCLYRRSDGDGRAHPLAVLNAPASGRMAVGEAITSYRRRPDREAGRCEVVGQLDGGSGPSRRGRAPVRYRQSGGDGTVPGAGHRHSGRQGFAVHENRLGGGWRGQERGRAAVVDRIRLRAGSGCAPDPDAAIARRPGR